jgi:hypothetical protein
MVKPVRPSDVHFQASLLARPAGHHGDAVGHHIAGVEADPELADQADVLLGVAGQFLDEGRRTGARDGSQVLDQLFPGHAGAVIGDGQCLGVLVRGQRDLERGIALGQRGRLDRQIAQPVAGIRRVGDQFTQEDLAFGIKRVGDDIQEPADLGLKAHRLRAAGRLLAFRLGRHGNGILMWLWCIPRARYRFSLATAQVRAAEGPT